MGNGKIKRGESARILYGSDFINGVKRVIVKNGIKAGTFSAIGILERESFLTAVKKRGAKKGVTMVYSFIFMVSYAMRKKSCLVDILFLARTRS